MMAQVAVITSPPSVVQVIVPADAPPPAPANGLPASVVKVVMDRGPSLALLTGIADEAATRERDDPLLLIEALINPGL